MCYLIAIDRATYRRLQKIYLVYGNSRAMLLCVVICSPARHRGVRLHAEG